MKTNKEILERIEGFKFDLEQIKKERKKAYFAGVRGEVSHSYVDALVEAEHNALKCIGVLEWVMSGESETWDDIFNGFECDDLQDYLKENYRAPERL